MDENNKPNGSSGSLIGSIIVVLILIIGAIYLFSNQTMAPATEGNGENMETVSAGDSLDGTPETTTNSAASLDAEAQAIASEAASLDTELENLNQEADL